MTEVSIPFSRRMEAAALAGRKCCTSRSEIKGSPGDYFAVEDVVFQIVDVVEMPLHIIRDKLFRVEGCTSPADFEQVWRSLHRGHFSESKKYWVHFFATRPPGLFLCHPAAGVGGRTMTPSPCPRCGCRQHTEDDLIADIYPHTLHQCVRCEHEWLSDKPERPILVRPLAEVAVVGTVPEEIARLKRACLQMEKLLWYLNFKINYEILAPNMQEKIGLAIVSGAACRRRVTEAEMISPPSETQGK